MDSIMDNYMRSGYANKHFKPGFEKGKNKTTHEIWKGYEVRKDFTFVVKGSGSKQITGMFLLYEEGRLVNEERQGEWRFYVIEDKTFNKILQKKITFNKDIQTGDCQYYFPDGNLAQICKFENNHVNGEVKGLYDDGKIYCKMFYTNGNKTGEHTYYYPNGEIKFKEQYRNDSLNGDYVSFYENKVIKEKFTYKAEEIDGIYQYYYSNGQLWIEKEYKNGLLLNVNANYDQQGQLRDKGTLKDGNGTVKYYTMEGKVYSIQTFKDGKKISDTEK